MPNSKKTWIEAEIKEKMNLNAHEIILLDGN